MNSLCSELAYAQCACVFSVGKMADPMYGHQGREHSISATEQFQRKRHELFDLRALRESVNSCGVCLYVCLLSHISPLRLVFVVKTLPCAPCQKLSLFSILLYDNHFGVVNPRPAYAARVTVVVVSVCVWVSVKSHHTSGASVRPENAVTYSAGDEGRKCGVFSEIACALCIRKFSPCCKLSFLRSSSTMMGL